MLLHNADWWLNDDDSPPTLEQILTNLNIVKIGTWMQYLQPQPDSKKKEKPTSIRSWALGQLSLF